MTFIFAMKIKQVLPKIMLPLVMVIISWPARAQDDRSQIPPVLKNSYFEVNIGYINYPFGAGNLESGYTFESVTIPHPAVRVVLIGHEFNKYLSAQISYMRPVLWVEYYYNTGSPGTTVKRSVWMNVCGITIKPQLPVSSHFTLYGEAGLAWITRHGFGDQNGNPVVKNANYSSILAGGGIKYSINQKWKLMLGMTYSPENKAEKQPPVSFYSAGFEFTILPLSEEKLQKKASSGYIFPKQMIQVGYASNFAGYGVNDFFTKGKIPVFWSGDTYVQNGVSINYLRNIFHGTKVFSLDWGAAVSFWNSNIEGQKFFTLSLFPLFRWTFLHTKPLDMYFLYSLAGPTYISTTTLDGLDLGKHFTFQDYIGTGWYFGEKRKLSAEIRITHYSNGNLFTANAGVTIPLSLNLGFAF
jgi:opacity protein-like surface antigen